MSEPTISPATGKVPARRARPASMRAERADRLIEAIRPMVEAERGAGVTAGAPAGLSLPLDAVKIGTRHRRDMGDIDRLARSIKADGLLHPIVVRPDGLLIAGERRVRAAKLLGWTEIPVTVVDIDAVVRGEIAENAVRKDFTLSEAVAIKRALEPREREAAKERQRSTARPLRGVGTLLRISQK